MIQLLTGLETPAGGRGTDTGLLVHNVGTAYAAHRALRHDRPLISRIVTVSGGAVPNLATWRFPSARWRPICWPIAAVLATSAPVC